MRKLLVVFVLLIAGLKVSAEPVELISNIDMKNFWGKTGRYQEKIIEVSSKILYKNKIDKHIVTVLDSSKVINAHASSWDRSVHIYSGILPYLDSDDELAGLISHEMAHVLDFYKSPMQPLIMKFNSKHYEHKADLVGIDLMTKAGYNPVAMIIAKNKYAGEPLFDFGFWTTHPRSTKRQLAIYKYISVKYPWALKSDMTRNIHYQNFLNVAKKDIEKFKQQEKSKQLKGFKGYDL